MLRLLALVLATVGLLPGAPAAPVPKHLMKEPGLFYPTRVGTKWIDECEGRGEIHATITTCDIKDGVARVVVVQTLKNGNPYCALTLAVSERGVYRLAVDDRIDDPPVCWLKLPSKPGDSWDNFGFHHVAGEPEVIEVPAGKFRAIPVEMSEPLPQGGLGGGVGGFGLPRTPFTRWFAPGVGLIRQTCGERNDLVLKSFKLVKD